MRGSSSSVARSAVLFLAALPQSLRSKLTSASASLASAASLPSVPSSSARRPDPTSRLRIRKVLVIHRHGDRTPITPMRDESYWASTLPDRRVLEGIARGTELVRPPEGGPKAHGAVGRGPFGQLTLRGVLQMVGLGERLREELGHGPALSSPANEGMENGCGGADLSARFINGGRLFTPSRPLHPSRVRVMSTDFPRTVQSVQALLTGLFPDVAHTDGKEPSIKIDLRDTNSYFIPDPQPRQSPEQLRLESYLSKRPHLAEREQRLMELASRVTGELEDHLGEGADGVSFGVGEEKEADNAGGGGRGRRKRLPLAWAQLAEILVCLHSREMLPPTLSEEDVRTVSDHAAWKWFENLRHPVLAKSAMWRFASRLVDEMRRKADELDTEASLISEEDEGEPWLCIYSAHDSTLIGLLCVLQLEQPARWPEYGSALKVELIGEEKDSPSHPAKIPRHWVRFSLNGKVLRSTWFDDGDGPAGVVPLDGLSDMVHAEHELFEDGIGDGGNPGPRYSWREGRLTEH